MTETGAQRFEAAWREACANHENAADAIGRLLDEQDSEVKRLREQVAEWDEWMRLTVTHLAVEGRIDSGCGRVVVAALTRQAEEATS